MLGKLEVQEVHTVKCSTQEVEELDALMRTIGRLNSVELVTARPAVPGDADYASDCSACVPSMNGNRHHDRCPRC